METKKFAWYAYSSLEDVIDVLRLSTGIKSPGALVTTAVMLLATDRRYVKEETRGLLQRKLDLLAQDIIGDPTVDKAVRDMANRVTSKARPFSVYPPYSVRQTAEAKWELIKASYSLRNGDLTKVRRILTTLLATSLEDALKQAVQYLGEHIKPARRDVDAASEFVSTLEDWGLWETHVEAAQCWAPVGIGEIADGDTGYETCEVCGQDSFHQGSSETGLVWSGHCHLCGLYRSDEEASDMDAEGSFRRAVERDD